jgi:PAS domain S-box-containing protein
MESRIRLYENHVQALMEHAPAAIAMLDSDLNYLQVNSRFASEFHLNHDVVTGLNHADVFPEFNTEAFKVHYESILAGETIREEVKYQAPNGNWLWFTNELCPWYDAGHQVGGILVLYENITQSKEAASALKHVNDSLEQEIQEKTRQLQEALAAEKEQNELRNRFITMASHEIRTPMNAVLGFTHLLQRKNLDDDAKEYVAAIRKSGENLLTLINDILDMSKIEAGMVRLESTEFAVRALLHSVEMMLKPKADEKKLLLTTSVDAAMPDILQGDSARLTQILINLAGNAIKFTDTGRISISIGNKARTGDMVSTEVKVRDTGIGIEKGKLQTIFERFEQAGDFVNRKYGGTGLGLSIVKELVLLQHGSIEVESEPGLGTVFTLVIPYKIATDAPTRPAAEETVPLPGRAFENLCILAVDDNEINLDLVKHLFKSWQLNFDLAKNGKEAISKLEQKKYDMVLMDIQMPEMDGYAATQQIRGSLQSAIPVIAMTAHAMAGEREKCISYGMNEYISKPLHEEELLRLITRFTARNSNNHSQNNTVENIGMGSYQFIDLHYMKEISKGNTDFEKTVTEQFIEAIPGNMQLLKMAWQQHNLPELRQLAHNMRTTVSVMGLNEVLAPNLDALEYTELSDREFDNQFAVLATICGASVEEAKQLYSIL